MLRQMPRMLWAQYRRDFVGAMAVGRELMGSAVIKTKAFAGYTPTKHDVFVCTYSKSGTYWMMQIVTQIAGHGTADFDHIHDIVPWPEAPLPGIISKDAATWQMAPAKMRAVKTHAEAQFVPYNTEAKYIIVLRDPKDVVISSYYFSDSIMPGLSEMGLDAWLDAFLTGKVPYGMWAEQVAGFWPWRDRDNVHLVTFAEMKQDLEKVVRAVAQLMQVELRPRAVDRIIERSGFAYMKANADKFNPPVPTKRSKPVELIRKGAKGESAELLTPDQLRLIDEVMKTQLEEFRSDFPYNDYF